MARASTRSAKAPRQRMRLEIKGAVQGVGFRPFVYGQARALDLAGFVVNTTAGVTIEVEGAPEAIADFVDRIETAPPPNASIADIAMEVVWTMGDVDFEIRESALDGARSAQVLPD